MGSRFKAGDNVTFVRSVDREASPTLHIPVLAIDTLAFTVLPAE